MKEKRTTIHYRKVSIAFDSEAKAAYIKLHHRQVAGSREVMAVIDLDRRGEIIGVEIYPITARKATY